jgi:hypothetical protein
MQEVIDKPAFYTGRVKVWLPTSLGQNQNKCDLQFLDNKREGA